MDIKQIIFNILSSNVHTWVKYWISKEYSATIKPGEYIHIRSSFLLESDFKDLFDNGFTIYSIQSMMIGPDAYCDILLRSEIKD